MSLGNQEATGPNAAEQYLKDTPAKKGLAARSVNLPIAVPAILLLLIAIPALCLWMTPDIQTQIGSIDTFVNTGYIHNSHSLVQRFGETYYALRVAAIAPQKLVFRLLSPETGFVAVRYLLLLVGCASIFAIVRRYFGAAPALYSALLLAFTPWYLRSITWEYVDGFAITYLLAAFACILAPRPPTYTGHFCAGAFLALAMNSNLYAIAIAGAFVPVLIYLRFSDGWRRLILDGAAAAAGFVLAYAVLAQIVNRMIPGLGLFFEVFTFKIAGFLLSGGSESWFETLGPFIAHGNYYVLAPPVILTGGIIYTAAIWRDTTAVKSRQIVGAFSCYLALVIVVYLVNHYAFHSPRITRIYYFSYAAIPAYLLLSAMIGSSAQKLSSKQAAMVLAGAAAIGLLVWYLNGAVELYNHLPYLLFAAITVLFFAGAAMAPRWPSFALAAVCIFGTALPSLFYRGAGTYAELEMKDRAITERDTYLGALHLIQVVERFSPPSAGAIGFWYNSELADHLLLQGIQSTYLFEYSRLPSLPPTIDDRIKTVLKEKATIVLLGVGQKEIASGEGALTDAGIKFSLLDAGEYRSKAWSYDYAILQLTHPSLTAALATSRTLSLATMTPASPAAISLQPTAAGVVFRSAPQPWAYIGRIPLHVDCMQGGGRVAADIRVIHGFVGVGVLNRKGDDFLASGSAASSDQVQTIVLPLNSFAAAGDLILRNWDQASSSDGVLESVRISAENGQTSKVCDTTEKAQVQNPSLNARADAEEMSDAFGPPVAPGSNAKLRETLPAELTTPAKPWAYGAVFPLHRELTAPAWVRVEADVRSGPIGIGVLNRQGNDFLARSSVGAGETTVTLCVTKPEQLGDLVIQSWAEGKVGDIRVDKITVLVPRSPAQ